MAETSFFVARTLRMKRSETERKLAYLTSLNVESYVFLPNIYFENNNITICFYYLSNIDIHSRKYCTYFVDDENLQ